VKPIVDGEAHLVVGDRQTSSIEEFSPLKKLLQSIGSRTVRSFSGLQIPDAVSGFRAISREAALRINIVSDFSYTIEMLLQAGNKRIPTTSVPVRTNPKTRHSRLFRNIPQFVSQSCATLLRIHAMYQPLRIYTTVGTILCVIGALPIFRFLLFVLGDKTEGHVQSLVIGGTLLIVGFLVFAMGLLSDLVRNNRVLIEQALAKVREIELNQGEYRQSPPKPLLMQEQIRASLSLANQDSNDVEGSLAGVSPHRKVGT
jgi:hypothetical protein